ncbi:Nramp family divalent metal transporter [Adhaeretor mobilis]|uniref:Divalent metal cation transporter MntH n=1 Tax=Adhaeretor mobilis TaxID=1930276 RepID=A0A517MPW1_9BACT|nr:Nramp family divalent metal transporter [Adhaeretor mobilis]QDS96925.1 Divalent metal cation transporter MntH [Adhaeretor mobilis]
MSSTNPTPTASKLRPQGFRRYSQSLGPAIIVACVVLGPGSILTSSKVGCQFGYQLVWLLLGAGILMMATVALAARVGVAAKESPCTEISRCLGRPIGILAGVSVFLIASCFQFSNNLGVLAALEPLISAEQGWQKPVLIGMNLFLIASLYSFKSLYKPLETMMVVLVGVMLLAFAANLLMAKPSVVSFLQGLIPQIPDSLAGGLWPKLAPANPALPDAGRIIIDPWLAVQGLIATTFSVAGAFYQFYLVREKGWTVTDLRRGLADSVLGTTILVCISLMIMVTSAAVLSGSVDVDQLNSVADVARQLEPLFGSSATALFCLGIFGGAVSSFLVNSIIGGTMLADGLGLDARLDSRWTKLFTIATLLVGMAVSLIPTPAARVPLIIFAQAITVLGGPLLAASLWLVAFKYRRENRIEISKRLLAISALGCLVIFGLAIRTAWRIYLTLSL